MTAPARDLPPISAELAEFLVQAVSLNVASCDAARLPSMSRAFGCRVSADRRTLGVFLSTQRARRLLADLRAGGRVAVVASVPSTHRTIQLKGEGVRLEPLAAEDRACMRAYAEAFAAGLRRMGYQEPFASALATISDEDAVCASFSPSAVFDQTPGPHAGRRLEPAP